MRLWIAEFTIGLRVELVRNGFVVPFEQILIEPVVFVEQLQRRFEALGESVNRCAVEALEIDAAHFEDDPDLATLGEKSCEPMNPKRLICSVSEPVSL